MAPRFPIRLTGARTHNLKGVSLTLEPGEVVAITGVSGSGKSSLALDTLYAEGQRRFIESFSPYARQFLERLGRPPVDELDPVAAGVSVDRHAPVKSSRSTVATMADVEPYLAALFATEAIPVCPEHGVEAVRFDPGRAAEQALARFPEGRALVTTPLYARGTEQYLEVRDSLQKEGLRRLWHNGALTTIDDLKPSEATDPKSPAEIVLDRVTLQARDKRRITTALENAWGRSPARPSAAMGALAPGDPVAHVRVDDEVLTLRPGLACPECARTFEPATPGLFSYESPVGACPACRGFGRTIGVDLNKVFPDPAKTLRGGAIRPWSGKSSTWERAELVKLCKRHDVPMDVAWGKLTKAQQRLILEGDGEWEEGLLPGVMGWFRWLETRTYKMHVRVLLARYRSYDPCKACGGGRLAPEALRYRVAGKHLAEWHSLEVSDAKALLDTLATATPQGEIARRELDARLTYLSRVGLGYLSLDRQARTLSGGEAQRITLTAALGTSLHNALFVLDEPTVGLHPEDVSALGTLVHELADRGNTVLVVEHDPLLIAGADRVIELGEGSGDAGGTLVADGSPAEVARLGTATARALAGPPIPARPRRVGTGELRVRGVTANNLQNIDVSVPLGIITVVTGPSGSGKSSLVVDVVHNAVAKKLGKVDSDPPGPHKKLEGAEALTDIELVDQSPLGRTSRGNAATYTKAWDSVRELFAREPAAEAAGLSASSFSFNVAGGRCEACSGEGFETVEMQFLADVRLECPVCRGRRFNESVMGVRVHGLDIAEVLELTVEHALEVFRATPRITRALGPLIKLGLGYLRLGQPLSTLSGGEAQRLKIARALTTAKPGTLFVLDEPSAGLHADEVAHLTGALDALVQGGSTVLVVDHDVGVMQYADHIIDMGPGAGRRGGLVVAAGTPEELSRKDTATGRALAAKAPKPNAKRRRSGAAERAVIAVTGAREHNLASVSVEIPHGSLTVVTGPSGSGKSSLAFDVVFAEGQRRFLETLTPYARRFLPTMPRPSVESVTGVPPTIALEQHTSRAGTKSTVATITEIAHYLRLLYAKLGTPHCPEHDTPIVNRRPEEVAEALAALRGKFALCAPVVAARKGTYLDVFTAAAREGIEQAYCDGELVSTDDPPRLRKTVEHTIDLVLAPSVSPADITEAQLAQALRLGHGALKLRSKTGEEQLFSARGACPVCSFSLPELDPRWFSFNTEQGRCSHCEGEGVVPAPLSARRAGRGQAARSRASARNRKEQGRQSQSLDGGRQGKGKGKGTGRQGMSDVEAAPMIPCPSCGGSRLAPIPRAVRFNGRRYHEFLGLSVVDALTEVATWELSALGQGLAQAPIAPKGKRRATSPQEGAGSAPKASHGQSHSGSHSHSESHAHSRNHSHSALIGGPIAHELSRRLRFMTDVGLDYLSLDRAARTLSGGELQRLRLAAQLGAGLTGALYVLDEPTIGLHPSDTERLLGNLRSLVDLGSTVLVVEHDLDTIRHADHLIDLGPGGGSRGGRVMAAGSPKQVLGTKDAPTAIALRTKPVVRPALEIPSRHPELVLSGASAHNLKSVELRVMLGRLNVVAGVSGSGKSTLVRQVLLPAVRQSLGLVTAAPGPFTALRGVEHLRRAIAVDQSPIGRTPRSVPATFLGIWDEIRTILAATPEAQVAGYTRSRFSFNTGAGGRCHTCEGQGVITHEMSFLPDVVAPCPACNGARFEPETLHVHYMGKSAGDILHLTAAEAAELFVNHPKIAAPLRTLTDLGAGYIQVGQGSHTLSGGEAQRLKLAAELTAGSKHEPTLYVLDEPTTGLHVSDVDKLIAVLGRLVERGDTLVVIEHHPQVMASADWLVELGPGGGAAGGRIVAEGAPRAVAKKKTATGGVLKEWF